MPFLKKTSHIEKRHGIEYKHIQSLRLLYIVIAGIIVGSIGLIIFFIYSNVYRALEDANNIIILRSELGVQTIDFRRLESVQEKWIAGQTAPAPQIKRDPFALPEEEPMPTSTVPIEEPEL